MARFAGYRTRFLGCLGIPVSAERLRFLEAWAIAEGGTAAFNAWNTTYQIQGATRYNSVGVRNYLDAEMGTCGAVLTIRLGNYDALVRALRAQGLTAEQICRRGAGGLNTWGTTAAAVARVLSSDA